MEAKQNLEEGCVCPACNEGSLQYKPINEDHGCSCHISPPCSYCTDTVLTCDDCGFREGDDVEVDGSSKSVNKHKDSILEYAKDWVGNDKPWELWECKRSGFWSGLDSHPIWRSDYEYRRKPKFININGFKVPEPYRGDMRDDQMFFEPNILSKNFAIEHRWYNRPYDMTVLGRGFLHLTKEAAAIHGKALASFTNPEIKP